MNVEETSKHSFEARYSLTVTTPGLTPVRIEGFLPLDLYQVSEAGTSLQRQIYIALVMALQELEVAAARPQEST